MATLYEWVLGKLRSLPNKDELGLLGPPSEEALAKWARRAVCLVNNLASKFGDPYSEWWRIEGDLHAPLLTILKGGLPYFSVSLSRRAMTQTHLGMSHYALQWLAEALRQCR